MLEIVKNSTERRHEEMSLGKRKSDVRRDRRRAHKSPPSSLYYWKKSEVFGMRWHIKSAIVSRGTWMLFH